MKKLSNIRTTKPKELKHLMVLIIIINDDEILMVNKSNLTSFIISGIYPSLSEKQSILEALYDNCVIRVQSTFDNIEKVSELKLTEDSDIFYTFYKIMLSYSDYQMYPLEKSKLVKINKQYLDELHSQDLVTAYGIKLI